MANNNNLGCQIQHAHHLQLSNNATREMLPRRALLASHAQPANANAAAKSFRSSTRPSTPLSSSIQRRLYAAATTHDVGVIGGGISGLATAYFLTRNLPDAKVTLYESKDSIGGWLDSKRVPVHNGNVLFEPATRTIRPQANGVLTSRLVCCQHPNALSACPRLMDHSCKS